MGTQAAIIVLQTVAGYKRKIRYGFCLEEYSLLAGKAEYMLVKTN